MNGTDEALARAETLLEREATGFEIFVLSDTTRPDVYVKETAAYHVLREKLDVVPLYIAAERPTVERDGQIIIEKTCPQHGTFTDASTPADLAPTLAKVVGITMPKAEGHALTVALTAPSARPAK